LRLSVLRTPEIDQAKLLEVLSRARRHKLLDVIDWAVQYEAEHPDKSSFDPKRIARQLFEQRFGAAAAAAKDRLKK
jgi:SOS response regulatory protein OraA/RecX